MFLPHPRVKVSIVGSLRDREVAGSASDRQGANFASCVWRTVSSQSSHHPQEVLLAQFSLYVHKGGLKPDSFHFICSIVPAGNVDSIYISKLGMKYTNTRANSHMEMIKLKTLLYHYKTYQRECEREGQCKLFLLSVEHTHANAKANIYVPKYMFPHFPHKTGAMREKNRTAALPFALALAFSVCFLSPLLVEMKLLL